MATNTVDNSGEINSAIFRSGTFVLVGKVIRHFLNYGTQLFLINLLAPQDFGLVRYVTIFVSFAILLNEMGLATALVQKEKLDPDEIGLSFLSSMFWGMLLYSIVYAAAPFVERYLNASGLTFYLRAGAIVIVFSAATSVHNAIIQRTMRYGLLAKIEVAATLVSSSITIVIASLGHGAWALVAGSLAYQCTSAIIVMFTVKIPRPKIISFSKFKPLFYFGLGVILLRLCDYARYCLPFLITGKYLNEANLGLFSFAYDLGMLPRTIINAVCSNVALVSFSKFQNDSASVNKSFVSLTTFTALFSIPLLLMMSIMSDELMQIICFLKKDSEWINAAMPLKWMALTGLVNMFSIFPGLLWLSKGKVGASAWWNFFMFATTVLASYIGVQWGLKGICVATFLRSLFVFPILLYVNYKLTGILMTTYIKCFVPALTCGLFMIPPVIMIVSGFSSPETLHKLIIVSAASLTGTAVFLFFLRLCFKSCLLESLELLNGLSFFNVPALSDLLKRILLLR